MLWLCYVMICYIILYAAQQLLQRVRDPQADTPFE